MKIKTDFVTNSSSSAFIVIWPEIVNDIDDVKKFIKNESHAHVIFKDIQNQSVTKVDIHNQTLLQEVYGKIKSGYVNDDIYIDYFKYKDYFTQLHNITDKDLDSNFQWRKKFWESHSDESEKKAVQAAIEFLEPHGGKYVYFFTYSDEVGSISAELEHENNWGGLPYLHISNH